MCILRWQKFVHSLDGEMTILSVFSELFAFFDKEILHILIKSEFPVWAGQRRLTCLVPVSRATQEQIWQDILATAPRQRTDGLKIELFFSFAEPTARQVA